MPHKSPPCTPVRGEPGPDTSTTARYTFKLRTPRRGGRAAHSRTPPAPRPPYPPRQPAQDGTRTSFVATKRHQDLLTIFGRDRIVSLPGATCAVSSAVSTGSTGPGCPAKKQLGCSLQPQPPMVS